MNLYCLKGPSGKLHLPPWSDRRRGPAFRDLPSRLVRAFVRAHREPWHSGFDAQGRRMAPEWSSADVLSWARSRGYSVVRVGVYEVQP